MRVVADEDVSVDADHSQMHDAGTQGQHHHKPKNRACRGTETPFSKRHRNNGHGHVYCSYQHISTTGKEDG